MQANELSPRRQFQLYRKEEAEKFTAILGDPVFKSAITYAMSDFVYSGVTTEEIQGAKKFLLHLLKLPEPQNNSPMPAKNLETLNQE